jgi:hypothetical protein
MAAMVTEKKQWVNLSAIFLTSNIEDRRMAGVHLKFQNLPTQQAIWDRIMYIDVEDDEVVGRMQGLDPNANAHRRADHSHLTFTYRCPHENDSQLHGDSHELTFIEIVQSLAYGCAVRELDFITSLRDMIAIPALMVESMNDREQFLRAYLQQNHSPLLHRLDPILHPEIFHPIPNAGNEFFVVRIQGPTGSGKTEYLGELSAQLSLAFRMPVTHIKSFDQPLDFVPQIVIVDDLLKSDQRHDYIEFVNGLPALSIVLLGTNEELPMQTTLVRSAVDKVCGMLAKKVSLFGTLKPYTVFYHMDLLPSERAYARRCGATLPFHDGVQFHTLPSTGGVIVDITHQAQFRIHGVGLRTPIETIDIIGDLYEASRLKQSHIQEVAAPYQGDAKFDVDIRAPSKEKLFEMISSATRCVKAFTSNWEGCTVRTSTRFNDSISSRLNVADWIVNGDIADGNLVHYAKRMIKNLRRSVPDINVNIAAPDYFLTYVSNCLYSANADQVDRLVYSYGEYYQFITSESHTHLHAKDIIRDFYGIEELDMLISERNKLKNLVTQYKTLPGFEHLLAYDQVYGAVYHVDKTKLKLAEYWQITREPSLLVALSPCYLQLLVVRSLYHGSRHHKNL